MPQIEQLVKQSFRAVAFGPEGRRIDPKRLNYQFEVFGFDFMIDSDFAVSIIEVNSNPCLKMSCPILTKMIPRLLDNTFRIVVDPVIPPPDLNFKRGSEAINENLFKLIFDEQLEQSYYSSAPS